MKLPNSYGFVVKLGKGRRKLTFSKIYEQWCKRKFHDVLVKAVYVVVYKNLSGLHNMRFAEIHKPFTSEELQTLGRHVDDFGAKVALILCYTGLHPSELAQIRTTDVHLHYTTR